jgi:NADH:ubiquinone oxidoreductase subunit F (NADH-binding)
MDSNMLPKNADRERVLERLDEHGGLRAGVSAAVHRDTGVPEADVYGVASFYHLLARPDDGVRVCRGLSCKLGGCERLMSELEAAGRAAAWVSCLGRCDLAPAAWDPDGDPGTATTHYSPSSPDFAIDLLGVERERYESLAATLERGPEWVLGELEASGLSGRGGAGFPAHVKWSAIRAQPGRERYIVLNADEGEPGTFKDREVILRRPHLVVEGLAVAAATLEAADIYCYVRGEFGHVKATMIAAVEEAARRGDLGESPRWHFVDGHGAYICGEESALLESLEGKRGMPRLRPPYPVEVGFRGKPTLVQNVETIACVPAILARGGEWFKKAGRTQAGSKLYCLSGHVVRPGVYEAPLGTTLRELLDLAGGVVGTLKAFSPGGASSGFLPADRLDVPLDFKSLAAEGSMLGSAGIVVLNDTVDMVEAALVQTVFFEDESCGQCAPCRIGTQVVRQALERYLGNGRDPETLSHLEEVGWGMQEASICGLGQAAPLALASAIKYWPSEFGL